MPLTQVAFLAVLVTALAAAFGRGGRTERVGGMLLFTAALLTPLVQLSAFASVEAGVATIDTLLLVALLLLAFRSGRRWPTFAAAFQAITVLTHLARFKAGPVNGEVYGVLLVLWSYPILIALLWGSLFEPRAIVSGYTVNSGDVAERQLGSIKARSSVGQRSSGADADLDLLTRLFRLHGLGPEGDADAVTLLARAGSFAAAVATPSTKLRSWGIDERIQTALAFARTTTRATLRRKLEDRPSLTSSQEAIDYLHTELAHLTTEQFRVLYLNARHRLICDEVHGEGTVTEAPVFPREVVKRAIEEGAVHMILAHNHPGGDPTPSRADIITTRAIMEAGRSLGLTVIDHIVISASGHVSMKSSGLI